MSPRGRGPSMLLSSGSHQHHGPPLALRAPQAFPPEPLSLRSFELFTEMIARLSPPSNHPSQARAVGLIFLCLGKDIQETGLLAKLSVMPPVPILRRAAFQ